MLNKVGAWADTGVVNDEMRAAGVWVFAGGLHGASTARVVRAQDGALIGIPEVVFRGVAHSGDLEELADATRATLVHALHSDELLQTTDVSILKNHVHDVVQKYLYKETRRRPLVLPVIVEV